MEEFLKAYFSADELTDQEVFVIMRYFDTDGEGRIDYNEFAAKILGKDVGSNSYKTTAADDGGDTMDEEGSAMMMTAEELAAYKQILVAAMEKDAKAAFLKKSLEMFKRNAEAISTEKLNQNFRANDVDFKGE